MGLTLTTACEKANDLVVNSANHHENTVPIARTSGVMIQDVKRWLNGSIIRYKFLDNSATIADQNAVRAVAEEWSNIANISFREVRPEETADLRITFVDSFLRITFVDSFPVSSGSHTVGEATVGMNSVNYMRLLTFSSFNNKQRWYWTRAAVRRKYLGVLRHEFGHVLGLHHEDNYLAEWYGTYDSYSVMYSNNRYSTSEISGNIRWRQSYSFIHVSSMDVNSTRTDNY